MTVLALSRGALTAGAIGSNQAATRVAALLQYLECMTWPLAWQAGDKTQGTSSRCRRQIAWYVAVGTVSLCAISIR